MYEELIKRLRETSMDFGELDHVSVLLLDAANAIEELQQRATPVDGDAFVNAIIQSYEQEKWIPVTERLPEYAGVYLCRIKSFSGDFQYTDTMKYVDGFFYERGVATERITHWMPLPSPPVEE